MQINETRRKLIDIIADHQSLQPSKKLGVGELSIRAGISRQAFNRYYGDLKDYAAGLKPVGDLLISTDFDRTKALVNQNQASLKSLQQKLSLLEAEHERELKDTLDDYITSLMINDVAIHGANEIRVTLEKQTLYGLELKKENNLLEIELSKAKRSEALSSNNDLNRSLDLAHKGEKIKVDIDLGKALEVYASTNSEDEFEDAKDRAINAALLSINKLAIDRSYTIVLFAERYVCRFALFFERYSVPNDSIHIIVRTPIFDRSQLKIFISKIAPAIAIHVYVSHMRSQSDISAQRAFYFNNIPQFELRSADAADPVTIASDRIDKIVQFNAKQGE